MRKPGSPMCSAGSPTTRSPGSMSCCPGVTLRCTCLAPLNKYWAEGEPRGQEVGEGGAGLAAGGGQRGEDLPGSGAALGLVAAGELAADDGRAQLPLGEVVGCVHGFMIEEGEQVVALRAEPLAQLFLRRCGIGAGMRLGSGRAKQPVRVGL